MNACEWEMMRKRFDAIDASNAEIKLQGDTIMAQIDDLNAAIQAEDVQIAAIQASLVKVGADIGALLAKITTGATPTDLTAQLQAIQSHVAALTTANQQLVDDDKKATA